MNGQSCENCIYWFRDMAEAHECLGGDDLVSQCRRNPPYIDLTIKPAHERHGDEQVYKINGIWPDTLHWSWCGEWKLTDHPRKKAE